MNIRNDGEKDHFENRLAFLIAKMVVKESPSKKICLILFNFNVLHAWKKV